jgi:hypothetical protein
MKGIGRCASITEVVLIRMAAPKGHKKYGGREKGTPNRATKNAREAIARFVDGNAHRLQGWLDEIAAEEGAKAAIECFGTFMEYHVPKLARTEHAIDPGSKTVALVDLRFVGRPGE